MRKISKTKKMTNRQQYKLRKLDKKVAMGANSGKTARAVSRHQAAALISGNINNKNTDYSLTVNSNIPTNTTTNKQPNKDTSKQDSTNILGWMN